MNWLRAIVEGFSNAIFKWGQGQAEKPKVTKDANTPKAVRDELNSSVADWMRDQDRDRN
jgi:hypothetical protein